MTTCEATRPAPFECPTFDTVLDATLQALPIGRAWQSNEGGPQPGVEIGFQPSGYEAEGFATRYRRPSQLYRFWKSIAAVLFWANSRLCDLRLEFWCATHKETDDLWMAEYGLPDDCDPYPDLCTKVAAIGGTRCEYYAEIAARMGWSIECVETLFNCGSHMNSRAGKAKAGRLINAATLKVIVHLNSSTAYQPTGRYLSSLAGRMRAGRRQTCGPDISPLLCLMSRIVHAEIQISYEGKND